MLRELCEDVRTNKKGRQLQFMEICRNDNFKHLHGISQYCIGCKNALPGVCSKKKTPWEEAVSPVLT